MEVKSKIKRKKVKIKKKNKNSKKTIKNILMKKIVKTHKKVVIKFTHKFKKGKGMKIKTDNS